MGVKRSGMKRTPGILRAFKYVASLGLYVIPQMQDNALVAYKVSP